MKCVTATPRHQQMMVVTPLTNQESARVNNAMETFELGLKSLDIFDVDFSTGEQKSFLLYSIFKLSTAQNALHQLVWLCTRIQTHCNCLKDNT